MTGTKFSVMVNCMIKKGNGKANTKAGIGMIFHVDKAIFFFISTSTCVDIIRVLKSAETLAIKKKLKTNFRDKHDL